MRSHEIRKKYLDFFKSHGHAIVPSAPLVPVNDPTTLFTSSGMQPLVPYLLGETHPLGKRVANSQRCFRAEDIEEVGDNRHTTFFEMLGNWSFGDYFKKEQLPWFFEFLTREIGLDPRRLYVTVFSGDKKNNIPRDDESVRIWQGLFQNEGIDAKFVEFGSAERGGEFGMQGGRIFAYDSKKNWWSRAGVPENMPPGEPGGPDSEVFYQFTDVQHDLKFGAYCHPNCDCGQFLEIGNSVFMEYKKQEDGKFKKLKQRNVDFGGGLERIAMAVQNSPDMFRIDLFTPIIKKFELLSGVSYKDNLQSFRIIADHLRRIVFMTSEGVVPWRTDRGYVLRRLLRRAIMHGDKLNIQKSLVSFVDPIVRMYQGVYPELNEQKDLAEKVISEEEKQFRETLARGMSEAKKRIDSEKGNVVRGRTSASIVTTYGLPFDAVAEIAESYGKKVDKEDYKQEIEKHRELSRTSAAGLFKGGLADHSEEVVRLHTATHLLNAALRRVLGDGVWQKGSNITKDRTRFDFTHPEKMNTDQIQAVENLVNQWVAADYPVQRDIVSLEEAWKLGAIGVFGEKYADTVSIYTISNQKAGETISREFCGGPHVGHTGAIGGTFKITKEEAVGKGIRRVRGEIKKY